MTGPSDVLQAVKGLVIAPAGCGKTQLIVDTLKASTGKTTLVLTHTNAGVIALRDRFSRAGVTPSLYRLSTIDAWAIRLVMAYPKGTGMVVDPAGAIPYTNLRYVAAKLIHSGALDDILKATYQRILVDEYQDCSRRQHDLVRILGRRLPTVVFGDPLQAIFGFGDDPLPDWANVVQQEYPMLGELQTPWRWNNLGAHDLGKWVLKVRQGLLAGETIDLRLGGERVHWRQLTGNPAEDIVAQVNEQYRIEKDPKDKLLIIGDSRVAAMRHEYARSANGVGVVERVDLTELTTWARRFDRAGKGPELYQEVIEFAKDVVVNLGSDRLEKRIAVIKKGTNTKPPALDELAALALYENGGIPQAVRFLQALREDKYRRIFRAGLFWPMVQTMEMVNARPEMTLFDAAVKVKEAGRYVGRRLPPKAVGSTLLLKGLESDHALILDAGAMTASNLYVALSRGAKSVTVFSRNPVIKATA